MASVLAVLLGLFITLFSTTTTLGRTTLTHRGRSCRLVLMLLTFPALLTCLLIIALPFGTLLLGRLSCLIHGIEHTEIMLGMLEIGLRLHPVSRSGRITAQLEIFLKQLLGRATDTQIRSVALKNMVPVQRNLAIIATGCSSTAAA